VNDTLHDFIAQLERHQAEGRDLGQLLSVDPVRQLALPLNHQTCSQLRAMAQVFQCDEALLASGQPVPGRQRSHLARLALQQHGQLLQGLSQHSRFRLAPLCPVAAAHGLRDGGGLCFQCLAGVA